MSGGNVIYGEKRRAVTFNLDVPLERELYELSKAMPFSKLVKRYLAVELQRRRSVQSRGITAKVGE